LLADSCVKVWKATRIFLSPPHLSGREQAFVAEAFESNYVAPAGPMIDAFEGASSMIGSASQISEPAR
jgi:pyridoxal phosphate-dependent aminotransferase EpsN